MNKIIIVYCYFLLFSSLLYAKPTFTITIERNMTCSDMSTMGRILVNDHEIGRSLELPWRNNETGISRIPDGSYTATIRNDGKRKWRIQLENVQNRKYIQIHVGNYQRQIEGCILVGRTIRKSNGECIVTHSKDTLYKLSQEMSKFAGNDIMTRKDIDIQVIIK